MLRAFFCLVAIAHAVAALPAPPTTVGEGGTSQLPPKDDPRMTYPGLPVRCTGAPGDAATLQAALDAARSGGSAAVLAGVCDLGATTLVLDGAARLVGAGRDATVLRYSGPGVAVQVNGGRGVTTHGWLISDLTISGGPRSAIGLQLGQPQRSPLSAGGVVERVTVTGFAVAGVLLRAAQIARLVEVYAMKNLGDGLRVDAGPKGNENDLVSFRSCRFNLNGLRGAYLTQYQTFVFDGCDFEGNAQEAILVERAGLGRNAARNLVVRGCWIESNNRDRSRASTPAQVRFASDDAHPLEGIVIEESFFSARGKGDRHVWFGPGDYTVRDNAFESPEDECLDGMDSPAVVVRGASTRTAVTPDRLWRRGALDSAAIFWENVAGASSTDRRSRPSRTLWATGGAGALVKVLEIASPARDRPAEPRLGFFGADPSARPVIRGARGGNAALADLLAKLSALGLVVDETTP